MITKIRCGLAGAGYVAAHHARAARDLPFVELAGVTDRDPARAKLFGEKFGIPAFGSLAEMRAASPDVIHVLTPPESQLSLKKLLPQPATQKLRPNDNSVRLGSIRWCTLGALTTHQRTLRPRRFASCP